MNKNTLGIIGLAAKARGIAIGTNQVLEVIRNKKSRLVLIASDVSENTRKTLTDKSVFYSARYELIDITTAELGRAVGHGNTAAIAFTDANFVKAYEKSLTSNNDTDQKRGI